MPSFSLKDFAVGTLSVGIAAGATSLTLTAGGGGLFPVVFPFLIPIWNETDFPDKPFLDPSVEVLTCTARTGDVLTINAAANAHNTGGKTYKIALSLVRAILQGPANTLFGANAAADKVEHKVVTLNKPLILTHATELMTLDATVARDQFWQLRWTSPVDEDATQLVLRGADWITMQNGWRVTPTANLTLDKDVVGAGGLEATAVINTWYRLYYMRKDDNTEALFGSRAKDFFQDLAQSVVATQVGLRDVTARTKLAQGVQFLTARPIESFDVNLRRFGTIPTGGKIWFELFSSSGGNPSALQKRSMRMNAEIITATANNDWLLVPWYDPFTPALATQYHLVADADYAISASNYIAWMGDTANSYANGVAQSFDGTSWTALGAPLDFSFRGRVTRNDQAAILPSGYTMSALIGYFYIDGSGNIHPCLAQDRLVWWLKKFTDTETSTRYTLHNWDDRLPPVPVEVFVQGANSAAANTIEMGPVPFGYHSMATPGEGEKGTVRAVTHVASALPQIFLPPIRAETQRVYLRVGGGTGNFNCIGWRW